MPTLRLVQEAIDPSGTHRVAVGLQEDGSRWSATAKVHPDLDRAELERLRWYLEDYLEYPIDPAPKIAAQVEQRLVELGRDLFGQVFQVRGATSCGIGPGPDRTSARRTGVHLGIIGPPCADGANRPKPG
jgi:hypothetical protein